MSETNNFPEVWNVPKQPPALTVAKYGAITVSSILLVLLFVRIATHLSLNSELSFVLITGLALFLGYVIADFVTGAVHWFCDTFFSVETRVIGKALIQPFRDHHTYPQRITKHKFVEQDTSNFFLMLPVLAYLLLIPETQFANETPIFWTSFAAGLSTGLFLTNVFHKWAHDDKVPSIVQFLQKSGMILEPARHRQHHRDHNRAFCVTSGWLNPFLDTVRFFPRLEILVRFLLKRPKNGASD